MAQHPQIETQPGPADIPVSAERLLRSREIRIVVLFYLLLFGLNAFRVFFIIPFEQTHLPDLFAAIIEVCEKVVIWIGLTYLFVVFLEKRPFADAVGLKNISSGLLAGLLGSLR